MNASSDLTHDVATGGPPVEGQPSRLSLQALRRHIYALLLVLAAAMAVGRVLSVELVYEPSLSRIWPNDPEHPRRSWPATPPRPMPTFSSNDRSRWAAVRALVDEGTWVVGRRDKRVVLASAPTALAAPDPLQLAVLLEAGYDRRIGSDRGIIFEDGWGSVDKMLNPATLEFYSTKPPLLTFLVASEYALLKKSFGWSLSGETNHRFSVVRVGLLTFNVLPFVIYLWLLVQLVERFGTSDWGRFFVVAAACFATLVTPFLITLNNHTLATFSVVVAVFATVRILSGGGWGWFVLAGFFAGFTAANELPAAAFAAGLGLLLLARFPWQTLFAFVSPALVPAASLLALNYAELGELKPGYSKFGTEWYEYEGSHWRNLPDQSKRGIDWAKTRENKTVYAFHLLLGHHGWFSLYPIYLLGVGGMAMGAWRLIRAAHGAQRSKRSDLPLTPLRFVRGSDELRFVRGSDELPSVRGSDEIASRQWAELAVATALLSLVVIGYYIYKSDNYGGWSNGPRWLMWLSPLWLLTLLPAVEGLAQWRWGRALSLALLMLSVLSAHYTDWNSWRHPWIYNWMDSRGWIPY